MPLTDFAGTTSWRLGSQGFARARVNVPSSLAGKSGMFRIVAGVSSDTMTDEVYCKTYALSKTFSFTPGATTSLSLTRTIPAHGATGVTNTGLQLTLFFDRDASLSATAASKSVSVKNGATTVKTIAGNSADIIVGGNSARILIGDVGSYEVEVTVPANLIESLPEQTITFTTNDVAAEPPAIINTEPSDNAVGIYLNSTISITVSADAAQGTGVARILDYESHEICAIPAASMAFDSSDSKASFVIMEQGCFLYQGMVHTLSVDRNAFVNPVGGLTLESNYSISFTAWVDTAPPVVVQTYPVDGATHISDDDVVLIWYSEDVYATDPPGNITITPRTAGKTAFVLPTTDEEQVEISFADDFTGEVLLWPADYFQPRTTYDVTIPADTLEDWPGNPAAAHTFSFKTGDNYAPYCELVQSSPLADEEVNITIVFQDWQGQDEPSVLSRGSSGKFKLQSSEDTTVFASVSVTDEARVTVDGLTVTIAFPTDNLPTDTYSLRWPNNILFDDYKNPVFKWSHEDHDLCSSFIWSHTAAGDPRPTAASNAVALGLPVLASSTALASWMAL